MTAHARRPQRVRGVSREIQKAALHLRREPTPAERMLWDALRAGRLDGLKFRRQHPVGQFILDFFCPDRRLVIEVDGDVHNNLDRAEHDAARTERLRSYGYTVLRFRNEQVLAELDLVLDRIRRSAM